ncbi:MAG: DUF721 domain-containing protein [Synergistaceae bacterium]|nr:DUF721 domain-containing protein [Synergistaceae bacterium]
MNVELDPYKMFPEAARRVKILEELQRSWRYLVEAGVAHHSMPYNLGVDELCICVDHDMAEKSLNNSKATVIRRISRHLGCDLGADFKITVTKNIPQPKRKVIRPKRKSIPPDEEKVRQHMEGAPETLPEDINLAISHLWAFLEQNPALMTPPKK